MDRLVIFPVSKEDREKFYKTFLDVVILVLLIKDGPMTGYRIISRVYEAFGILVAPSVIYPMLYSIKERGLIKEKPITNRSRIFSATEKGKSWVAKRVKALAYLLADLERRLENESNKQL